MPTKTVARAHHHKGDAIKQKNLRTKLSFKKDLKQKSKNNKFLYIKDLIFFLTGILLFSSIYTIISQNLAIKTISSTNNIVSENQKLRRFSINTNEYRILPRSATITLGDITEWKSTTPNTNLILIDQNDPNHRIQINALNESFSKQVFMDTGQYGIYLDENTTPLGIININKPL